MILYGTPGCHLCDEARAVVAHALGRLAREVDIVDDARLLETYGMRIPVLKRADTGAEVDWPFGPEEVLALAAS
jgi:hypothetical protein